MSIFSAIGDVFKRQTLLGESKVGAVTRLIETAIVHPIGFVTNTQKAYDVTAKESLTQKVIGAGSNALLVTAPLVGAVKTAVVKTVSSVIAKAPVKSAVVGLISTGVAVSSPTAIKTAVKTISSAPESLVGTGEFIGGVIEGTKSIADIENKDVKNIALGLGLGAVATGVILAYGYLKDKKADKVLDTGKSILPGSKEVDTGTPKEAPTMETTSINPTKKRRRHPTIKDKPSMRQSLRVNIFNSNNSIKQTKTYLNNLPLYN